MPAGMVMSRRLAPWVAGAVLLLLTSGARAQSEADLSRARVEFERGVAAFELGNYEEALASFQTAQRIAPHPNVRVNMANCYEALDRPVEALFHFRRFLEEAGGALPSQRREVQASVERLAGQVGEVRFQVAPDGALVRIDGEEIRRAPIVGAVPMSAGRHTVEVRADGFVEVRREFIVLGGEEARVTVVLEERQDVPSSPAPEPLADRPANPDPEPDAGALPDEPAGAEPPGAIDRISAATWVLSGTSLALLVGAAVTGGVAVSAENDVSALRLISEDSNLGLEERRRAYDQALADADRADALAIAADVLGGLSIACATAAVVLLFLDLEGDEAADEERTVSVSPAVHPNGAGATALAHF